VSKDRARRRAEREAEAAVRAAEAAKLRRERLDHNRKKQARAAFWRSIRFWRKGTTPAHVRERRAIVASGVFGIVMVVWAATRSMSMTVGVGLVSLLAAPVALAIMSERSKK
jgi:hypothetical protein